MSRRGKKRTKAVAPTHSSRIRRDRVIVNGLAFDFTTPSPDSKIGISICGNPKSDTLPVEVRFDPPLEKIYAGSSTLSIMHLESKRTDTRLTILPHTDDKRLTKERYFEFVTHVCKMDTETVGLVQILYVTLENEQLRGDNPTPIWRPAFNLSLGFFERYQGLPFFPPDTPLDEAVDLSQIPQNSGYPITHKPAGGITSSRVPKLLGFYPGPDNFNGWRSAAIRFGRISEAKAALTYLNHHEDYIFKETGFISLENGGILDGAMCDGLITSAAGDQFPVEFKASRSNCNFEAAHLCQVVWQMATGFPYADLVRYCERQIKDPRTNTWCTSYECREIRLYRHPETETRIIQLCQQAHGSKQLDQLTQTEPYVQMRQQLENLAAQANKDAKIVPVDKELLDRLAQYKEDVMSTQNMDNVTAHPLMDRIEQRQSRIFAAFYDDDKDALVKECCEQIRDYTEFL